MSAELTLALGAGMLAAVNPCGFALLPAYLSLLVAGGPAGSAAADRSGAVRRALVLTAAMTGGFVAVFGAFGLVVSPLASSAQRYLPWVTVVIGLVMVLIGLWVLAGRSLGLSGLRPRGPELTGSIRSMVLFGVAYAAASLTCTVAPFLAIVVASFRSDSALSGALLFVTYAVGMGIVVGVAAMAVALASTSVVGTLRRTGRWVPKVAGLLLVAVGAYVAYYGWWEIRVLGGADAADPVVDAAIRVQQAVAGTISSLGTGGGLVLLGLVVAAALLVARRRGRVRARR